MPSYVVTGVSRGLGYEFIRQYALKPENIVFGLVRKRSTSVPALLELEKTNSNVHILEADVTDTAALKKAVEEVKKVTGGILDVLVNNAALAYQDRHGYTMDAYPEDEEDLLEQDLINNFKVNAVGALKVTNLFLPLIRAAAATSGSAKVIMVNTAMADLKFVEQSQVTFGGPYSVSKAALLMATAKYAVKYRKENIIFLSISPGFVNTFTGDLTPKDLESLAAMVENIKIGYPDWDGKPLSPEQSVLMMFEVFDGLTIEDTGKFVSQHGNQEWL